MQPTANLPHAGGYKRAISRGRRADRGRQARVKQLELLTHILQRCSADDRADLLHRFTALAEKTAEANERSLAMEALAALTESLDAS